MKYYIKVSGRWNTRNAGSKAPLDVERILEANGYKSLSVNSPLVKWRYISLLITIIQYIYIYILK